MTNYTEYYARHIHLVVGKLYQTIGTIRGICEDDDSYSELTFDVLSCLMLLKIEVPEENSTCMVLTFLHKKNVYVTYFDFVSFVNLYLRKVC